MIQKTKRPISILLVLLMIVGMFSVLPISAGATSYDSGSITFSNLQVGDTVSVGVSCFEGCPTTLVLKGGTYGVNASEGRVEQICNEDLSAFIDPDGYGFYNDSERIFVYEWANPSNRYFLCNQDGTLSTQMVVLAKEGNTQDGVTLTVGGYDPASVPVDYYVVGTMNSWAISEDYKMVLNENNTSEYWIQNVPLHSGDEIKVVSSTDGSTVQYWYPDGTDNNLAIGEDGYYNVYVAPAGHNTWHYNCILATKQSDLNYVAQIGTTKYETLADAFAAAVDGDTITLLADCAGNGIKVTPAGKFATNGLTVDFAGHTYTVDGETVGSTGTETNGFQLLKNNKVTFTNGTITSAKAKILVQNYSDLTLDGMTLTLNNPDYTSAYTLSNNNGNIVIDDTTINANPAGGFAFDVCRYASYPSVNVTVTGNSVINGDVEIFASKGDAKDGFSLTLESGSMSGDIVVDATAQALVGEDNKVTKADTFTQEAPEGYEWVDNGDGTSSLAHVHDWDYQNVTWTFTENASHSIYAKYTLTCKTDPTHTKEQTGSGTLMSTVAVDGDKFVYSHSAVKIDGISVAVPNYTRNVADGIINRSELVAASKVAGEYKLANDITGFYDNVKPVDGFVLDGQNHMIKYGTMNANNRVMFVAADQNTKFTLKNITLDGNNRAKWAVCAYTGNSGNNAGNVITLDTVTIQNFKSNDYVGAINAFGSSTWNLKDCTITGNTTVDDSDGLSGSAVWAGSKATINIDGGTYDEVYLHSYSGTGAVLNADGGATIDNLVLDLTKTDTLKANIGEATVGAITANDGIIPEEAVVMDPDKATVAAPEGYEWVDSDETGMKTLAQIVYVAQIGTTKYETLAEAFAAAQDGDIITVLADSAGNGIKVAAGKFATNGLTVDFNGHTYTVNANTVGSTGTETQGFQLLKNNKITFENGTINGDSTATATLKFLIQNYSDLTLDNMNLELVGKYFNQYTLSNNNGNIVINNSTINAPDYTWAGLTPTQVNSYAFDVCRYASYPSVNVTVTGNSTINGDVQVDAGNGDPKNGFSLTLESGTLTGDIVLTDGAKTAINADPEKANVTKANDFTQEAPEGYEWVDNGDGTSTLGHVHDYTASFNWTQSAEGADWDCDKLTLTCSCGDTKDYEVAGYFGSSAVTCTANADGSFTYTVSKTVDGETYSDTKTVDADGHIKTNKQLTAAAKKGGEWQLDNDLNGVVNVVCADGFVLNGNGYKVTRNSGVDTNPVFRINSNPAEVTLKNMIIDGIEGRTNTKAAIATRQSNPSAGNVLNLENVHIENYDISATNNGAVLAWGQATVNLTDSTVTTDSAYDVWAGAAATVNINGGTYGKVYLNGGTSKATVDGGATVVTATYGASAQSQVAVENGTVRNIALADGVELAKENFIAKTPETALVNVPAGYVWVDSETTGMKTLDKAPADLFVGYGLSLQGDIGLIFYLDPAAADIDIADVDSVAIDFDCDHYTYQVTDFTKSGNYIKVTCYVPAAYMAHDIKAYHVKINDVALDDTNTYSVQQYAQRIIDDPVGCNIPAEKADDAKNLMKEMLNYGAKAQEVFKGQMLAPADYDDIPDYTMATVTADMIDNAIQGEATDMSTVHPEADANFYAPSVIYLSKTTLRMVFLIPTGNGSTCPDEYTGKQAPWYYWKDVTDIPAAELDKQQEFEINGVTFHYSVLDYAKAVVAGGSPAQKDLAASLYLYNQAAKAYFAD